jgi:hypothetical protein
MQQQAAVLQHQIKNINLFMRMIENRCFIHHNLDAFVLLPFNNPSAILVFS